MSSSTTKILLVDDDELSRRMMALLLSERGYNYDTASNGIEAIEAVQSQAYSIVLMDIQMPLMDGFEATWKIREWEGPDRHIPIIALTAMLLDDEVQRCLSAGMDDCVPKPFNAELLFQTIERQVGKAKHIALKTEYQESALADKLEVIDIPEALPRFSGDLEVYRDFLTEFIENLPQRLAQFQTAFLAGDFKELADSAHNLKGISASMGAKRLSYLSQKLDRDSQNGNLPEIKRSLEEVEKHISVFKEKAIDILSGFKG